MASLLGASFSNAAPELLATQGVLYALALDFMPTLYQPSFAVAQGWSALSGTIAVSICSAATAIGATLTGWLVDRYHATTALSVCTIGTAGASKVSRRERHDIVLFSVGKGIGSVISDPISGALVASDSWRSSVGYTCGSGYGYLIIFPGVTPSFATIGWLARNAASCEKIKCIGDGPAVGSETPWARCGWSQG
ncbi:hypothetical protein C8A03DRAFT_35546 [Achaetomium macrosporum]|uniref:Major facilitator superfamily (MFS) profile domain-containing protein n=1 Tax=Achaetomium macrosporum TaxID=79813 RepID=A0AAN7C6Y9_9PEZI|nr:hypothetical protein C8A03DRAFT_35546 [Achaetomium macrosporum]